LAVGKSNNTDCLDMVTFQEISSYLLGPFSYLDW